MRSCAHRHFATNPLSKDVLPRSQRYEVRDVGQFRDIIWPISNGIPTTARVAVGGHWGARGDPGGAYVRFRPVAVIGTTRYRRGNVSNRAKLRRDRKAKLRADHLAQVARQKLDQRTRRRAAVANASTTREKVRHFLNFVWKATGGPIVAITGGSPFSKGRKGPPA